MPTKMNAMAVSTRPAATQREEEPEEREAGEPGPEPSDTAVLRYPHPYGQDRASDEGQAQLGNSIRVGRRELYGEGASGYRGHGGPRHRHQDEEREWSKHGDCLEPVLRHRGVAERDRGVFGQQAHGRSNA